MRGFMKCRAESLNDWTVHAVDIPTASHLNAVTPICMLLHILQRLKGHNVHELLTCFSHC